jgi:hypothetical protein
MIWKKAGLKKLKQVKGLNMSNEQVLSTLNEFVEKIFPEFLEDYEIKLIAKNIVDPESEFVKRTMLDFQLSFNSEKYDSTSNLCMSCEQLAKAFKENDLLEELQKIWNGTKFGMSIPDLEYLVLKGVKGGRNKEYEIEGEYYSSSGLNRLLKASKREILGIFGQIQMAYNLKPADFDWSAELKKSSNVSFDDLKI